MICSLSKNVERRTSFPVDFFISLLVYGSSLLLFTLCSNHSMDWKLIIRRILISYTMYLIHWEEIEDILRLLLFPKLRSFHVSCSVISFIGSFKVENLFVLKQFTSVFYFFFFGLSTYYYTSVIGTVVSFIDKCTYGKLFEAVVD